MPPAGDSDPRDAGLDAGLRDMFDQMLEGVQLLDADFRYRYLNESAARHGHRSREELVGRRMQEMYPGIENTEVFGRIETCLRDRTHQRLLNEFTYPDGTTGWFDLRMAPVPAGVLILSVDISEQKRAERDLRGLVQALEDADRRKTDLLTMLAHELRNPLAPILNGLHVLRARLTGGADETTARAADIMDRQLRHLAGMVDDLVDATRIERGSVTITRTRLDLARVVRDAVTDHSAVFAEDRIALRSELPDTPVWVSGDAARLTQIVANLLDNARKFSPAGGSVVVRLTAGDLEPTASIAISDTGIGIAADVLPLVFEPLFQADTSLDRTRGGLGVGLAVAKGLVELHGGTIAVESEGPGHGTTVRLKFPREPELPAVTPAAPAARSRPKRTHVLIIEDNLDSAKTLAMILDVWGYQVGLAHTGPEGLDRARAIRPDIVICDIGLPGMDGYAVARALRSEAETRSARIIAITGYGREDDRARALDAGFDLHLVKPVNPEFLRTQLEAA